MKKLFAILIMCSLSLPVLAIEEQEAGIEPQEQTVVEEVAENEVQPAPTLEPESTYKQPTSKKKLAKKFIIAMVCVVGTSIFLYGTLSIYNKMHDLLVQGTTPSEGEKPLDAPTDLTEAVKTFVEKTKWNG